MTLTIALLAQSTQPSGNVTISLVGGTVGLIGGIIGILSFAWRIFDYWNSYLQISISTSRSAGGSITALTSVQNKSQSYSTRQIYFAMLLVGPESEGPVATAKSLFEDMDLATPNDLIKLKGKNERYDNGRAFIPLVFYTDENVAIGDEAITYRASIPTQEYEQGTYSVRFFLYPDVKNRKLHRVTHDLFAVFSPGADAPFPVRNQRQPMAGQEPKKHL
jgi:hypothetical protein